MIYESRPFTHDRGEILRRVLRPIAIRLAKAGAILSIILVGTILVYEYLNDMPLMWGESLRIASLIFALLGVMFGVIAYTTWNSYRSPGQAAAFAERTVTFDEDAFQLRMASGIVSHVPWSALTGVQRETNTLLLVLTTSQKIAIPNGVFSPEGQDALFRRVENLPG